MSVVEIVAMTVWALVFTWGVASQVGFLNRLKSNHPGVWKELGKPGFFNWGSRRTSLELTKFLREKRFEELNDPTLSVLGSMARVSFAIVLVCVFGGLILALLQRAVF